LSIDSLQFAVKILKIRLLNDTRSLRAFADIQVCDWIVRDFRVIKQNGGRAYVSPPQVSWKDPETGKIMFKGILQIPPEQKQIIDIAILAAYQGEMEKTNGRQS
jgi:DNA-binding cell septation regulator SpoVG